MEAYTVCTLTFEYNILEVNPTLQQECALSDIDHWNIIPLNIISSLNSKR